MDPRRVASSIPSSANPCSRSWAPILSRVEKKRDVWRVVSQSQKPIGGLLLDQSVVAGVGNIFRAELLYEIGLNPYTLGCEIDSATFDRLWRSLGKMMRNRAEVRQEHHGHCQGSRCAAGNARRQRPLPRLRQTRMPRL